MTSIIKNTAHETKARSSRQVPISRFSESIQETNLSSEGSVFDIPMHNLLPLISNLKEQNIQIKHQKDILENEMKKLDYLSKYILNENQQMRNLYQGRSTDIKKIIQTISINTNQDYNDVTHLSHMIRQHNSRLVKQIQEKMYQNNTLTTNIQLMKQQVQSNKQRNIKMQESMRTTMVKIGQLQNKQKQLQIQLERGNQLQKIQLQVDKNTVEVIKLKQNNVQGVKKAQLLSGQNSQQKPLYSNETINMIQKIKSMGSEVKQMQEESFYQENLLQQAQKNNNILYEKFKNIKVQQEKFIIKEERAEVQIQNKIKIIDIFKEKNSQIRKNQEDSLKQRDRLLKLVQQKKQTIRQIDSNHNNIKNKINEDHSEIMKQIKKEIQEAKHKNRTELAMKLNPQAINISAKLNQVQQEYTICKQEVQGFRTNLRSMDNPIKEIIKLQYMLKKYTK